MLETFIIYLDANNLYRWAMSQPLPVGDFKWMTPEEIESWDHLEYGTGCNLEVDLKYPEVLHDLHNDYPLAPERMTVGKVEKLIPNLCDKTKYVIHHKNLRQYLELGLELTRIHRGIRFTERPWLTNTYC